MSTSSADRVRPIIPVKSRTPRATLTTAFCADEWTAGRIAAHLVRQHAELFGTQAIQFVYGDVRVIEAAILERLSQAFEHCYDNVLVLKVSPVSVGVYRTRGVPLPDEQTWMVDFVLTDTTAVASGVAFDVKLTGYVRHAS